MKQLIRRNRFLDVVESSLVLHLSLVVIVAGLFAYVYSSHNRILNLYEKSVDLHKISIAALLMSEENYHTQLEVYEVFVSPDKKRVDDFYLHEKEFFSRLDSTYIAFEENKSEMPANALSKLQALKERSPVIQEKWRQAVEASRRGMPIKDRIELLIESEKDFDEQGFNLTIKEIIDEHLKQANANESRIHKLVRQSLWSFAIGIFVTFLLICGVIILYRGALKGRTQELQLVQAGKLASLGQMSAGMAHELNNPLMFIRGFNGRARSVLKKSHFEEKSAVWEYLDEIDSGVERITKIVRHFKDFARLSSNELLPVSINEIIKRSFVLFEEQLRLSAIAVNLDLDRTEPIIRADANRIEQTLLNFISNSRDALNDTKGGFQKKITVRTFSEAGKVIVEFSDNGVGISEANLSRIFDPFFTTKAVGVGTGLGLSISAGIIRDHGGTLEVESQVGEGTRLTISFPAEKFREKAA